MRVFHFQARNSQAHKHALFNDATSNSTSSTAQYENEKNIYTHIRPSTTDAQPKTAYLNSFHPICNYMNERFQPPPSPTSPLEIHHKYKRAETLPLQCRVLLRRSVPLPQCSFIFPLVLFAAGFIIAIAAPIRSHFCLFCHRPFSHSQ